MESRLSVAGAVDFETASLPVTAGTVISEHSLQTHWLSHLGESHSWPTRILHSLPRQDAR
jgi:hypothetical protein